jgi:hypothetical protein
VLLAAVLGVSGCKTCGVPDEGLRESDLSEPARQARSKSEPPGSKDSKAADDPWMSDKAQRIARDLQ